MLSASVKKWINRTLGFFGYQILRADHRRPPLKIAEATESQTRLIEEYAAFTMTSVEKRWALINSIQYISKFKIPGAIVECGVWKGGSMMIAARELLNLNDQRELFLYDTFSGMSAPTVFDHHEGLPAITEWEKNKKGDLHWGHISLDEVRSHLHSTGYPMNHVRFVPGKVEETLQRSENLPKEIALLRLDTDWYESTKIELEILFPRVSSGGVIILDDFGYWEGARKAALEHFSVNRIPIIFHRIDDSGRIGVKI